MLEPQPMLDRTALRPEHVRPLTADDFMRLVHAGAFEDSDRHVELLRGVLVEMTVQEEPHARISAWFHARFVRALDDAYEIRGHTSFHATDDSVPEPDVQVLHRAIRAKLPKEALLIIEVSDTSLRKDREIKASIYAENGIGEYWIVDVNAETVYVHTGPVEFEPKFHGYRNVEAVGIDGVLRPIALTGVELRVTDVPWNPKRA
jgi:Uma2 family endonuclease